MGEHDIERIEKDIEKIEKTITDIIHQISTNKEKYMPAVALINELKVELTNLREDAHNYQLHMSQAVSTAQQSTDSAHKRLDQAYDVVKKLEKLPDSLRRDFIGLGGFILILLISFGVWIENNITEIRIKQGIFAIQIEENKKSIKENSVISNETHRMVKDFISSYKAK